jgi:hypothetical protein
MSHRGPHPEDADLFTEAVRQTLRTALEEARYLLDRGYTVDSVLDVVGRPHELRARQRMALQRPMCRTAQEQARRRCCVPAQALRGQAVEIDGFNQIISMEVALARGLLLRGPDGAFRDLAGLRGSYRLVEETDMALAILVTALHELGAASVRFFLDQPVSNSGRLGQAILARPWPCPVAVEIVHNPDRELYGKSLVVTSDAAVLDRVVSWCNLTLHVLGHIAGAWVLDLQR